MKATRSSPDRFACISSPNARSVAVANRRLTADFDFEDDTFSTSAPTGSNSTTGRRVFDFCVIGPAAPLAVCRAAVPGTREL